MPYKLQGNTVTKDDGTVVKRHKNKRQALAHLVALRLNVQEAQRDYHSEYADYHGKLAQIKRRAKRNAARRKMQAKGKVRDGQDVHHRDRNPNNNSTG